MDYMSCDQNILQVYNPNGRTRVMQGIHFNTKSMSHLISD